MPCSPRNSRSATPLRTPLNHRPLTMLHLASLRFAPALVAVWLAVPAAAQTDYPTDIKNAFSRVDPDYANSTGPGGPHLTVNTGRFFANPSVYALDPGSYDGGTASDTTGRISPGLPVVGTPCPTTCPRSPPRSPTAPAASATG